MTDARSADTAPLNPPDVSTGQKRRQLEGEEALEDQDGALAIDEVETARSLTDTELYEGEIEAGDDAESSVESLASIEWRSGETSNPDVAAEEGEAWVPPIDPPVIPDPDAPGGIAIAAGFGTTAQDEPFDADHHTDALSPDDEVTARVREALAADSRTSRLVGTVAVGTFHGVVVLRGVVDDIDDGDLLAEVASAVQGVVEVRDETEVEGL